MILTEINKNQTISNLEIFQVQYRAKYSPSIRLNQIKIKMVGTELIQEKMQLNQTKLELISTKLDISGCSSQFTVPFLRTIGSFNEKASRPLH